MRKPDFAGNAVFAKVRCLYGKHLTNKNYNDLLSLRSVNEVAEYLKTKTSYSEIFEGISATSDIQRGQLEVLLNNKLYNDFSAISRFQEAAGNHLHEYFIIKYDTFQIINVLSCMTTKSNRYFFTFPAFYNEHSKLDLYAMAKARNENELLETVKKTIYYNTLKNAISKYRVTGNLTVVQSEFVNFLDEQFLRLATGKKMKFSKKDKFGEIYKTLNDVMLLKTLYRMNRFSVPSKLLETVQNPVLTAFTPKQLHDLVHTSNAQELNSVIAKTPYREIALCNDENSNLTDNADEYLYKVFSREVRHSSEANIVMFSYIYLCENEIRNIIHIIEGIRYKLSPDEIMPLLCGVSAKN